MKDNTEREAPRMSMKEFVLWRTMSSIMKSDKDLMELSSVPAEVYGLRTLGKMSIEKDNDMYIVRLLEIFEDIDLSCPQGRAEQ